jgi:hypothetical protein
MTLTKAKIKILFDDQAGSRFKQSEFDVQFNPTEYTRQKGAQIAEIPIYGIDSPILQFVRGQNEKLTVDLFFDTTAGVKGDAPNAQIGPGAIDVRTLTEPFYQLVKMQPVTHAPPRILFIWGEGDNRAFHAIVESVQQKFDLFSPEGIPLRATLSLSLREYKTLEEQLSELKPQSTDRTRSYVVKRGDTLNGIAATEYGDPHVWRVIAEANDIANPRDLRPGTTLQIPALDPFGKPRVTG